MRAEAAGFKAFVVENVGLVARDVRRVDVKLEVGDVATQVEVSGGATLIETETARITDTKDSLVLNTIPTNSRGLWAYLNLTPGPAGAGRQQRDALRRQPREREQLVDRRNHLLRRCGQYADRSAGQLHRVVPGGQDRPLEQLGRVRHHRPGDHRLQVGNQPAPRHGVRLLLDALVPRQGLFRLCTRHRHSAIFPAASIGGPVWIPKIYNGKNKTFFYFSYETSRGSSAQDRSESDRCSRAMADRRLLRLRHHHHRSDHRPAVPRQHDPHQPPQSGLAEDPGQVLPAAELRRSQHVPRPRTTGS